MYLHECISPPTFFHYLNAVDVINTDFFITLSETSVYIQLQYIQIHTQAYLTTQYKYVQGPREIQKYIYYVTPYSGLEIEKYCSCD